MSPIRVAAIVGPTAAGKTAVSVEVAEALGAEIVSVDSMQIYRGMDVGTDKATPHQRRRVPHHLLDLFEPTHEVGVAEFQRVARRAIDDISARGCLPLLVGGSGLYFRAVVDDLRFPPSSADLRAQLAAEAEADGSEQLYERLRALDPVAAAKIQPGNARRTIRALEVIALTGRRFSENASAWERYESRYRLAAAGLTRPRAELYERITERVDEMIAGGLFEEARRLKAAGPARNARQALGYRQVLEMPSASGGEVREAIVRATKRFARRQESWFRADPRLRWFDASRPEVVPEVTAYLAATLGRA